MSPLQRGDILFFFLVMFYKNSEIYFPVNMTVFSFVEITYYLLELFQPYQSCQTVYNNNNLS